jgi:uncharacterized protein with von Willebrand factor type A (vWA) domain
MTQDKQTEFVRLVNEQPLTLACSALADFLWDDFIRDSRPSITYLVEQYNIKQLSRFGKELFERLYNADDVAWLVTESAFEDYFRAFCDGDTSAVPQGYKPENSLWYSIMAHLSQAAAWPALLERSVGNQFNAGNNAINILNELSKVIEEAIEQSKFDVKLLTGSGDELEKLREKFAEANAAGDKEEAEKARQQGKKLGQKILEALQELQPTMQSKTQKVVDRALQANDDISEALSALHGDTPGKGKHTTNLQEKLELAKKLRSNRELRKLVEKLGALRRIWQERKRAKKIASTYEEIKGVSFSDDIVRAFPAEMALASSPEGKALFALRYTQKSLLTKDYTAHRKDIGKGPIIVYIDTSGSMSGQPELWSKAIAFMVAEEAAKNKRDVEIHLFDTQINGSVQLKGDDKKNTELLNFVGTWTLGGGTSFNAVLIHALRSPTLLEKSDILLITDGESEVNTSRIKELNDLKKNKGVQWSTVCINTTVPPVCRSFSDDVYSVDINDADKTIDVIQKCLN